MSKRERHLARVLLSEPGHEPKIELKGYPTDARRDVRLNGTVLDVLRGLAGHTVGCAISNICDSNKTSFPHPVVIAAVTPTKVIVVTKVRKNGWADMVLYHHRYGRYVDLNDKRELKKAVQERPEWADREFLLRRPSRRQIPAGDSSKRNKGNVRAQPYAPKGALGRAVKAGLIAPGVARSLHGNS